MPDLGKLSPVLQKHAKQPPLHPNRKCRRYKQRKTMKHLTFIALLVLTGCAGPNPNIGERTADTYWQQGNIAPAYSIVYEKAHAGYPWAQLRLGVMYELGAAVNKDIPTAIEWYNKAAAQKSTGGWAEGLLAGSSGEQGFFNQNGDARIAQFQLANIYLSGNGVTKDAEKAYKLIATVLKETKGVNIFYCCEFAGGKYITAEQIQSTFDLSKQELSEQQISTINSEIGL